MEKYEIIGKDRKDFVIFAESSKTEKEAINRAKAEFKKNRNIDNIQVIKHAFSMQRN